MTVPFLADVLDLKFAGSPGHAESELQIQEAHQKTYAWLASSSIPKFAGATRQRLRTSESGH
jgi:hypothetical protein